MASWFKLDQRKGSLWAEYIDIPDLQKKRRIRELNVMIAFMVMKYKKNYIKGVKIILLRGSFVLAIKMVIIYIVGIQHHICTLFLYLIYHSVCGGHGKNDNSVGNQLRRNSKKTMELLKIEMSKL